MSDRDPMREVLLGRKFVTLADSLVTGFDVVELLDDLVSSGVDLLDLAAAGLMLTDQQGKLQVMAASSMPTHMLELFELQNAEGPCLDCFRTGQAVASEDLTDQQARWPRFAAEVRELGFGPVYALPMRLRDRTIGAFNLFRRPSAPLTDVDLELGQALADVATIAILQHRTIRESEQLAEQLQAALNSRIVIEQAKGALAERAQVDVDVAFTMLRRFARQNQMALSEVAGAVASGSLAPSAVVSAVEAE
jgi:GAF domain-containing protein